MINPNLSIEITASTVAWYAAIVATISVAVSIYNALRDRAKISISYQRHMRMINPVPPYEENKDYFIITVTNKGRRPAAIGMVAVISLYKGSLILGDSMNKQSERVIDENNPETKIIADLSEINFSELSHIVVYDRAGRKYKKYFYKFPTFRKWIYRLKNHDKK